MNLHDVELQTITGENTTFGEFEGKTVLVVNVASQCGYTPQYAGLQMLFEKYRERQFTVLGFPCNQFLFQEPGSAEDILNFCTQKYQVTFPLFDKVHVKGHDQHKLYAELSKVKDAAGKAGSVKWNFEKFLVRPTGEVLRFRSDVTPESTELVLAIEEALSAAEKHSRVD